MSHLQIKLLGGFALQLAGRDLPPVQGRTARSLAAYLLYYRDRPLTRDLLAGIFWPDMPDARARRRLSQALWQIRKTLRAAEAWVPPPDLPPLLITTRDMIQVNPDVPLRVDTEEFKHLQETCLREGPSHLDAGEKALLCYQGPFLAGAYEDWIVLERERLRDRYLDLLDYLIGAYKRTGDYENALRTARRLTRADPLREAAHREVMQLCHLLDRGAEALQQYETLKNVMAAELGAPPGPETQALAVEIAGQAGLPAPALLPSPGRPTLAPRLERPDQLPLVGRDQEQAGLIRSVEQAGQGQGGMTALYGEAGVGKSRLMRAVAANAAWRDVRTVWGRCYELDTPPAYQPLVEALRAGLRDAPGLELDPVWRAALAHILPELATEAGPPPTLGPEEERRRLLEAIAQGFLALGAARPTLVILEDAHWMDPASLEALRYLLPRLPEHPLLFVITLRPEDLTGGTASLVESLEATRQLIRLSLSRLSPAQTDLFIQTALELSQPAPRFSARLYTETEGNPFFLIEILWSLLEDQLLFQDARGNWNTPWDEQTEDYTELPLPTGITQSIQRRLDRLPAALADLLQLASVIGRAVPFDLWLAAGHADEDALLEAAQDLCARGLLLPADPSADQAWDYAFTHDLIRRVTYNGLPPPRRRQYHQRVATAFAAQPHLDHEALANHWTLAGTWEKSAAAHEQAGDRARQVYANLEAAAHYTQALTSLDRISPAPPLARRYALLLAREAVFDILGDRERQQADLAALAQIAEKAGDDSRRAEVALRRANYAHVLGDYPQAIQAAESVISLARAAGDLRLEAVGHTHWSRALSRRADYEAARSHALTALTLVQGATLPQVELECLNDLGRLAYYQGDFVQAKAYYDQALAICRQISDPYKEWDILNNLGLIYRVQSDYPRAQDHYERALFICRRLGDRRGEGMVLNNLGTVHRRLADYRNANRCQEQALTISRETGDRWNQGQILTNLGVNAYYQGDYGEAQAYFARALALWCDIGNRRGEAGALANLGCVARHLGNYVQGKEYLEVSLRIFRELGDRINESVLLRDLSLLYHFQGLSSEIHVHAREALKIARGLGDRSSQGFALTLLGHAEAGLGNLERAEAAFREAAEIRQAVDESHLVLEPLAGLASVAARQGDLPRATSWVETILEHLETGSVDGTEDPFLVYQTCFDILLAVNDPRAAQLVNTANSLLQSRAGQISDLELRQSFLSNVPIHREITQAYNDLAETQAPSVISDHHATIAIALPCAEAPLGRRLREDEFVTVTWTVRAEADYKVAGKVARRRHRILRLLAEAQAQGASPRDEDLAEVLQVSLATLRRDVAALRRAGYAVPTRWRARR